MLFESATSAIDVAVDGTIVMPAGVLNLENVPVLGTVIESERIGTGGGEGGRRNVLTVIRSVFR